MTNYIWITTQKEGYHYWRDAPKEVSFLRNVHRHIFHFKVFVEFLNHNDREIEFFLLARDVKQCLSQIWATNNIFDINKVNPLSCEMMADELYNKLKIKYHDRDIKIEVNEDQQNGCEKTYTLYK